MKRYNLHRDQAKQILENCNPLGLTDVNGRMCVFDGVVKCYEVALNKIYGLCPAGWIDVPYCIHKLQSVAIAEAETMCGYRDKAVIVWDCSNDVDAKHKRTDVIRSIFIRMLKVTGCSFSEAALSKVLYDFDLYLEQQRYYSSGFSVEKVNIKFV